MERKPIDYEAENRKFVESLNVVRGNFTAQQMETLILLGIEQQQPQDDSDFNKYQTKN